MRNLTGAARVRLCGLCGQRWIERCAGNPATLGLLAAYRRLIESSAAEGLAAVIAYEMQAPAIAASKASGLRRHYGLDEAGTRFWDIHATMDQDHARWGIEALPP